MKLSIEEAFKQAEPGPAKAYPDTAEQYCCVEFPETGQAFIATDAGRISDVTAALLAHCFNHFLEVKRDLAYFDYAVGDETDGLADDEVLQINITGAAVKQLRVLLKKIETVELIP